MRRFLLSLVLASSLAATGAMAAAPSGEPGRLAGLGASIFGNSFFHFGAPNLRSFPVSGIRAGRVGIQLQHTRLSDVQRAYGGTIYQEGSGMGMARWLCYTSPSSTTWFISNMLGGGEFIMMVASQAGPGGGSCDPAPAGFQPPQMGIPGLGARLADLKAHFGSATLGSHSDVSYRVDRPARDGLGTANDAQYVGYVVRGGSVVGVGVGETTAQ
ncbi:MAG TPA: hypothetical protein VHB74_14755 [Devosia sp.]|nr:hypothetical protein [Devosia sp.]